MKHVALFALSAVFAWTVFRSAGVLPADWNVTLLALAALAFVVLPRSSAPRMESWLVWPLALLPAWVLAQMAPLPPAIVRLLSPARAELAAALGDSNWVSFSVFPAMTLAGWSRLAGCALVFLIARELAWRYSEDRECWIVILPLVAVGLLEAALGLWQFYDGAAGAAHGTYHNRDHFAGLMEMALPFPVMLGYNAWRRGRSRFTSPLRPALVACGWFAVAVVLLLAAMHSLSRMGFLASLFALGVLGAAAVRRLRWLLAVPAALVLLAFSLPSNELIVRFAELSAADKVASLDRVKVWRETLPMLSSYPVTGSGLETFEFAFPRYKRHAPTVVDNFAHNDYLQYCVELGVFGFALGLVLVGGILASAARAASRHTSGAGRALALASLAALAALLLHSLVDFNTYIPANAFACSWIAGVAVSAMFSSRSIKSGKYVVLEMKPVG